MECIFLRNSWLLIIPLLIGISLLASAWFLSYPLSIVSPDDWIFNHVSSLYWIGLPLTLASLYMIGLKVRNSSVQCIVAICIFLTMYSLSYYYFMLPGSDAQLFRGLNEYYSKSFSLAADNKWHFYYEWPVFFTLNRIMVMITDLTLFQLEFLVYALIGSLTIMGLHMYVSKNNRNMSFLPIVGFSIAMWSFFNYQAVPFSLAFSLLTLMIAIEKRFESIAIFRSKTILLILLFIGICFTHMFVAVFFIFYLLARYLLNKDTSYLKLIFLTVVIYLAVQLFQAPMSFSTSFRTILDHTLSSDLSTTVQQTFSSTSIAIDTIAQMFSRVSILLAASVCGFGFMVLLLKRKLTNVDKAFFLSGLLYLFIGVFLPVLGSRAIPFVFIPVSMGVYSFMTGRRGTVLKTVFLISLILFTFVLVHHTFFSEVQFQTKEAYTAENFMLTNYAWNDSFPPKVVIDFRQQNYLIGFEPNGAYFIGLNANFSELNQYDCIIYTIGLAKILASRNITIDKSIEDSSFNLIYSNGFTTTFTKYSK